MDNFIDSSQIRQRLNLMCAAGEPFIFVVDYAARRGLVLKPSELAANGISCSINGIELNANYQRPSRTHQPELAFSPIPFADYKSSFTRAISEINDGNSYLLNLTFATDLGTDVDLAQIYSASKAPYRMLFGDRFAFHSPESFIKITDDKIYSFPMKGTIDSEVENAENRLIDDDKERYEHNTIVDLIRNDLSRVARGVTVDRFRYTERIKTSRGEIIQTSSQISGNLDADWRGQFGDILFSMLPAGSISGAPKQKTVEIIEACETSDRGFYCGVMGFFDGTTIDSCVIIRYIERSDDGNFYYRSGGGITSRSRAEQEYNELIKKIYVPII